MQGFFLLFPNVCFYYSGTTSYYFLLIFAAAYRRVNGNLLGGKGKNSSAPTKPEVFKIRMAVLSTRTLLKRF